MKTFELPYGRQCIDEDDIAAVVAALRSDFLTQGPLVRRFEAELGKQVSAPHVTAVANGTAALHVAYAALGLGPESEIITSPITFVATANAARLLGANVRFADVERETGNIDPRSVEKLVNARTRGIVAVHFGGLPADLAPLREIADRHGLFLVEDAAHALGATYRGEPVGSCHFSDATTFSFHPVKHITTGEGGAVTTRDQSLKTAMDRLREHGIERRPAEGSLGQWGYQQEGLGFNYRLSELQSALGLSQLEKLPRWVERRRKIAERYRAELDRFAPHWFGLAPEVEGRSNSYHLFPVQIDYETAGVSRGELMRSLRERGVGTQVHYIPVCDQPYYRRLYGEAECPNARRFYESELSLPMFSSMTDEDVDFVVTTLEAIFDRPSGGKRNDSRLSEENISWNG